MIILKHILKTISYESEDLLKLGIGPGVGMWRRFGVQAK
jgi:hypothetical protein